MRDKQQLAKEAAELYQQQKFAEVKEKLQQLLKFEDQSFALHNQLGNVCSKLEEYAQAEHHYQQALKLQPDALDVMYNLALSLRAQQKNTETIASLVAVLKINPHYYPAHFMLGRLLLEKNMIKEANEHFYEVYKIQPDNQEVLQSIVVSLLQHEAYQLAKFYCEKLAQLKPDDSEVLYNLAVIAAKLGEAEQAIQFYRQVLYIKPDHFPSLNNLAVLYLEQKNKEAAKHYFEEALKLQPDDEAIQYTLGAISGTASPKAAPKEYIKSLFDNYADHYDVHLQQGLEYKVPTLLKSVLEKLKLFKNPQLKILDLGCGTGLCGEVFKGWASELSGVDLAEKMLAVAKEKQLYKSLVAEDLEKYLTSSKESFDLILAADVFIYIGDLKPIFEQTFMHLLSKGVFAFSVELCKKGDYQIQASGRFSHSAKYLKQLAKKAGFKVKYLKPAITRKQDERAVDGAIVVLQK